MYQVIDDNSQFTELTLNTNDFMSSNCNSMFPYSDFGES